MRVLMCFLCLTIVNVKSADRNRLKVRPRGIDNFDLKKFTGKWYAYAKELPCTWKGATQFSDWDHAYHLDSDGQSFTMDDNWRKDGTCTTTTAKATLTSTLTATLTAVDQLGDLWSGQMIIMCTDYRNYYITWGCVKESVQSRGICDDYWYSVRTRKPKLSQIYIDEINKKLDQLWGTSLSEMTLIPQNNPCHQPVRRAGKMFKTY